MSRENSMKKRSSIRTVAILTSILCASSVSAYASPVIPSRVRSHLGLDCTPKCTTCHDSSMAGRNNARRPFALSIATALDDNNLDITSADSIEVALDQLRDDGTDSDGDQISDIKELTSQPPSDPSIAGANGNGQVCIDPEAQYGCGARFAREDLSEKTGYGVLVSALVLVSAWFRRRRVVTR